MDETTNFKSLALPSDFSMSKFSSACSIAVAQAFSLPAPFFLNEQAIKELKKLLEDLKDIVVEEDEKEIARKRSRADLKAKLKSLRRGGHNY